MLDTSPPYNPLDRVELGKSVERALLAQPLVSLPPADRFGGAGLYAIYYSGDFPPYQAITPPNRKAGTIPLYVGRAMPRGGRAGLHGLRATTPEPVLFNRLRQHAISIRQVEAWAQHTGRSNLRLIDFHCRYLVVDDIWVALGEALLIGHFRPVWNGIVAGFGIHAPGAGRRQQARSDWDTLHPGRPFADTLPVGLRSAAEIESSVESHLAVLHPPDIEAAPAVDDETIEELLLADPGGTGEDDTPDGDTP